MPEPLGMPRLGMIMTEGAVSRWLKEQGAAVRKGEPVVEVESDKFTHIIESPGSGVLHRIVEEGVVVPVESLLGLILAPGETAPAELSAIAPAVRETSAVEAVSAPVEPAPAGHIIATPIARRLASEAGVDLSRVAGSGPGGRIVESDVQRAIQARATPAASQRPAGEQRAPLSGIRQAIARRMMQSVAGSAQVTLHREIDATSLVRRRAELNSKAGAKKVSFDALLIKALAVAAADFPSLNSRIEGEELVIAGQVNVGFAVAVEGGLVVPVVRNANQKSAPEISAEIDNLSERARRGELRPADVQGGTITITNLGAYGVDQFTPILNPPQTAILGVGRIAERPYAINGLLGVRPTAHLSLTFDHRAVDGAPAAQFLGRVVEALNEGVE